MAKTLSEALAQSSKVIGGRSWLRDEDRYSKIFMKDIPFMIADDKSIVCIPRTSEVFSLGLIAKTGKGKTVCGHRILSELFWLWGVNIAIMNDSLEETYNWSNPLENKEWISKLKIIGENVMPDPLVYVYPNSNTLNLDLAKLNEKNYLKISIPFVEVIENSDIYMRLGNSAMYFRNLKDSLIECETINQIYNVVDTELPDEHALMKFKIKTAFDDLFNEGILNLSDPEIPAFLKMKNEKNGEEYVGNPFSVLMKANLIPSFMTSDLYSKRYKSRVFAYYINALFENQYKEEFKDEETYLFFDELTKICSTENKNEAGRAIAQIFARGRTARLGGIYATQMYNKIPFEIRENTRYLIAFQHSSNDEVNEIKKDFTLPPVFKDMILNLKVLEAVAITKDNFACYKDNERWETNGPIRGTIIPPMSDHKPASMRKLK